MYRINLFTILALVLAMSTLPLGAQDQVSQLYDFWHDMKQVSVADGYSYIASGVSGVRILDVTDLEEPSQINIYDLDGYATAVLVEGAYLYALTQNPAGLFILDISDPGNPTEVGNFELQGTILDVAKEGDLLIIADGDYNHRDVSMLIIDVSDPESPHEIFRLRAGHAFARGLATTENYVFMTDYRYSTIKIVDISDPENIFFVGDAITEHALPFDIATAGDLACVAANRLFVFSTNNQEHTMQELSNVTFDRDNARNCIMDDQWVFVSGYSSFNGCWIRVMDLTDPSDPYEEIRLPTQGGTLSMDIDDDYLFYTTDNNSFNIIDVSEHHDPELISSINRQGDLQKIAVSDGIAYIADKGSLLRVVDVQDPENPVEINRVDLPHSPIDLVVSEDLIFMTFGDDGIAILDVSDRENIQIVATLDLPGFSMDICLTEDYAYIANSAHYSPDLGRGLYVIDIRNIEEPTVVGHNDQSCGQLAISGNYAYSMGFKTGLHVFDISDPTDPVVVGDFYIEEGAKDLVYRDDMVYIAHYNWIGVYDVSDPENIQMAGSAHTHSYPLTDLFLYEDFLLATDKSRGLLIFNILNLDNPELLGVIETSQNEPQGLDFQAPYAYVAGKQMMNILDCSDIMSMPLPPYWVEIPDSLSATAGDLISFSVEAADLNHDEISMELDPGDLPDGWDFTCDSPNTGTFTWQTERGQENVYHFSIIASDAEHETVHPILLILDEARSVEDPNQEVHLLSMDSGYPNPFNSSTNISYILPRSMWVNLSIFDMHGRVTEVLAEGYSVKGKNVVTWNATDVPAGTYIAKLSTPGQAITQKILLVK